MIQRKQTLYLLIVLALTTTFFYLPIAELISESATYTFIYNGIYKISDAGKELTLPTTALAILLFVSIAVTAISIFMYKKRMLQIRLCALSIGLLIGLTGLSYYLGTSLSSDLSADASFRIVVAFPIVAIVLVIMAIKGIGKDEALLRSMDRLR